MGKAICEFVSLSILPVNDEFRTIYEKLLLNNYLYFK